MAYDTLEAARLVSWSNKQAGIGPLTEAELTQWIDDGVGLLKWAFTYQDNREEIKYVDFPTMISLRLICRLHLEYPESKGMPLKEITAATPRLRRELGVNWPFASKEMWNPFKTTPMVSGKIRGTGNIKAAWIDTYNFLDLYRQGRLDVEIDLEFGEDGIACAWLPVEDIKIDPRFVSGSPCLAGTRIPTGVIVGMAKAGDSIAELAEDYGLPEERISNAVKWENQLADVGV